ncbi:MAG: hypothetical protein FJ309_09630 [Planctomycetes bacterium]|nr:hypothetical protein [Planctomycetota bacterium]
MRLKTTFSLLAGRSRRRSLGAALGVALLVVTTGAARGGILQIGNILTFSSGSTAGNPPGTWTLDDKSFTYLDQSGFVMTGTGGPESIKVVDSLIGNVHSLSLQNLGNLVPGGTYTLGYRVDVIPSSPYHLSTVALDTVHLVDTVTVYKDVYSTFSLFQSGTAGAGNLAALTSVNGSPAGPVPLAGDPTQVWVRDTIVLGQFGQLDGVSNTYTQAMVPEIDPGSAAPVLALVVGCLACVAQRRSRRAAV